jgi:hypothetical protein
MPSNDNSFKHPSMAAQSRGVSRRVLVGAAWLLAAAIPVIARAAEKVSQKEAGYQASPKGGAQCGGCVQFEAPASCKLVDGAISPSGWCTFFAPRPR